MSNAAITWCSNLHPGRGPKGVLFCLADRATDHAGEDWTCFPSVAEIVRFTDYSRAAVERNLQLLWREGYISRKRRRRADGTLGIYDYTLHRDEDRRTALKAARAAVQDVDAAMEEGAPGEAEILADAGVSDPGLPSDPHRILQHGPCVISHPTMRQNTPSPCGKMSAQEPSREPLREPSPGARAGEDPDFERLAAGFAALEAVVPRRVLKFTDRDAAFAAFAVLAGQGVDGAILAGCARRMADDPDFRSRKHPPPLETWLAKGQWRGWLADDAAAGGDVAAVAKGSASGDWDGPPELRAAYLAAAGPGHAGKVASFLLSAVYEPGPPARLVAWSETARRWLVEQRGVIEQFGLVVDVRGRV